MRGSRGAVVVRITVVLTGGLVVSVLLVVIRDIVTTTLASTSAVGVILKVLLAPSNRRGR
ncbi:hypothetical protein ACWEWI_25675 [Streptomyces sp. NPDC003753]